MILVGLGLPLIVLLLPFGLVGVGVALSVTYLVFGFVSLLLARLVVGVSVRDTIACVMPPTVSALIALGRCDAARAFRVGQVRLIPGAAGPRVNHRRMRAVLGRLHRRAEADLPDLVWVYP